MQRRANAGSIGHGKNRARHCNHPAKASITPEITNKISLFSDTHTSCGTALTNDTSVAPLPIATKSAGSAQHNKVEALVNKEARVALWWDSIAIPTYFLRTDARIASSVSSTRAIWVTL